MAGAIGDPLRSRGQLVAANVLLRQQLIVLRRQIRRPRLSGLERLVFVLAVAATSTWREAVLVVQPEHRSILRPPGGSPRSGDIGKTGTQRHWWQHRYFLKC